MLKRIVMLIMLGTLLSSCAILGLPGLYSELVKQSQLEAEIARNNRPRYAKDGCWAYQGHKEVFVVVKEVLKRPINKEVQFKEIKILIPENTKLNSKIGNIVDMRTGYGLPIVFYTKDYCDGPSNIETTKKRLTGGYYHICYHTENKETKALFEKISKVNGFTKGCK